MNCRIIAKLDVKGPNLVKGVQLEGLRVLGKPELFAAHYYAQGVDELIFMDVVASLYQRNNVLDIVSRTSNEIFIPLTVGGGLRGIDDIQAALRAGADKVAINTGAISNPKIISAAAERFGSSTIILSIDAKRQPGGKYEAYVDGGRERTGVEVVGWARQAVELGVGEILLTSIDHDGTGKGFDIDLIHAVSTAVPVPVIASGGAGNADHVGAAVLKGKADAVALGAMLHYECLEICTEQMIFEGYRAEGNIEFLKSGRRFSKIQGINCPTIRDYLHGLGVRCRTAQDAAAV